jgi:UDP-N-acetylmuramyl tripeptide synthase
MVQQTFTTILGKSVRMLARARGGGSALPGLFVEKIDPNFIQRTLSPLPRGVVLISGTNGKTTTTKMVVELLEGQGLRVFTNRTGSNFTRGVAAALLGDVDMRGELNADIAVLELDEAYATHFVRSIQPRYSLFLNVMRDQLDRFGEIDTTAKLLHMVAAHTTEAIVINHDDPRLNSINFTSDLSAKIASFSVSPSLHHLFPSDDTMRGAKTGTKQKPATVKPTATLEAIDGQHATIRFDNKNHEMSLKIKGIYNLQNAVGAIALVHEVMGGKLDTKRMLASLANVTPAFGRGETVTVNHLPCELVLVKNPSGFRLGLKSFESKDYATMIAINDSYADGRDVSWLWDVDFDSLKKEGVAEVSGIRAFDMALRLQYDEVIAHKIEPDLKKALAEFISNNKNKPKRIYCTYTAMLALRRELANYADVEAVR